MSRIQHILLAITIVLSIYSCQTDVEQRQNIEKAEQLITSNPDSALCILGQIATDEGTELHAKWCALNVWAAYRAYQPEINEQQLQTAFNYFVHGDDRKYKALVYYLRAVVHEETKNGEETDWMEDLRRGCREVETTDAHFLAAQLFHRYGVKLQSHNRLDETAECLNEYYARSVKSSSPTDQIIALINLSNLSLQRNREMAEYSEAITFAQKAVGKALDFQLPNELGKALGQLSICYGHAKQYQSALDYAIQAKDIDEQQYLRGNRKEVVRYIRIADAHRKLGNADSALYYARKSMNHPLLSTRMNAVQMMYMVHRDLLHDYEKSTHYMEIFQHMKDSLSRQLQSNQVLRREMETESAMALEEQKTDYCHQLWIISVVITLLASLVFVYRMRLKRQREQLDEHAVLLQQKDEHEQQLTDELVNENSQIKSLHESPRFINDDNWKELFSVAEKAYPNFISTLRNKYPILTDNDIQVALLMKLHFTGTQIATMMAVSPSSVTKQKQRMKKRLAQSEPQLLQSDFSLDAFISSL